MPQIAVNICEKVEVWYFFIAGTLRIAKIGIRKSMAAIIGAPILSIIPRMLGLSMATIQVVITINNSEIFSTFDFGALV